MPSTLRANNDLCFLSIELTSPSTYAEHGGFDATMVLQDVHWDGDHEHPISLQVEGLFLSQDGLMKLCNNIDAWVEQPLDKMAQSKLEGEFRFDVPSQSVLLRFGEREDTISALNLTFSFVINSGKFASETSFVTDQSCLRLFSQALRREIHTVCG